MRNRLSFHFALSKIWRTFFFMKNPYSDSHLSEINIPSSAARKVALLLFSLSCIPFSFFFLSSKIILFVSRPLLTRYIFLIFFPVFISLEAFNRVIQLSIFLGICLLDIRLWIFCYRKAKHFCFQFHFSYFTDGYNASFVYVNLDTVPLKYLFYFVETLIFIQNIPTKTYSIISLKSMIL